MNCHSWGWVCFSLARLAKSAFALLLFACVVLSAPAARADNLHYFKNYFLTGDYTVAGVGLFGKGVNGVATGTINMTHVNGAPGTPDGADIVAAFLYWQSVETTSAPSSVNGTFDGDPIVGEALGSPSVASCWSQGGTAPNAFARVYRADVLRYLPVNAALNIRVANGNHTVKLPDSGNSLMSVTPHTEGATLVVIYRMLPLGAASYKAVVIYDGNSTMSKFGPAFSQTLGGFYDAATTGAKMTHIVGNGQPTFAVGLTVNGKTPAGVNSSVFDGSAGARWDNPTFAITLAAAANSVTTQVSPGNNQVCLSWGAVVMSTDVENSDGDGILNSWKTKGLHLNIGTPSPYYPNPVPATFGGCADYPKDPCENFPAMGAVLGQANPPKPHPDVFAQVDWLEGNDGIGNGVHIHAPKLAALCMVANVFRQHSIYLHFDVGNNYQLSQNQQNACPQGNVVPFVPYIVPWKSQGGTVLALGGNVIQESSLTCPDNLVPNPANCAFPNLLYSAIGWKKGFDAIKNGFKILGIPQYFPHDRKDTFHYILFGHAVAVGSLADPHVPASVSGVADTPGGDLLVTMGLWPADDPANCVQYDQTGANQNICINQTGTALQQAGTMLHELGHNAGLYHGGSVKVPNCMPDYQSVMNYLYQTRGLTDVNGVEQIDFSSAALASLNLDESALYENQALPLANLKYRVRYYAPASPADIAANSQAKAHCDGSSLNGTMELRKEAPWGLTPDWDNDGDQNTADGTAISVDINFNGTVGNVIADSVQPSDINASDPAKQWFVDHNDWASLNLQQVGGRLNVDGLSADISAPDLGQADLGQADLGQADLGQADLGQADLGQADLGQADLGQADLGDIDYGIVISTLDATGQVNPPQNDPDGHLVVNVVSDPAIVGHPGNNEIVLNWGTPNVGQIRHYFIYRENMSVASPQIPMTPSAEVSAALGPPVTTFTDPVNDFSLADSGANCPPQNVCYNTTYRYFITAADINGTVSTPSNFATATVDHVFVTPYSGSVVYGNPLPDYSSTGASINGLPAGALTSSGFSCTNTTGSVPPRNVGAYTISCTGPATVGAGGAYGVTYNADATGTLTITPRPLTIAAVTTTKTYDSTTSASATPTVTGLAPAAYGDTVTGLVETYSNSNAGSWTLSVSSYTVADQNSGKNYSVTLQAANGVINPRPLTIVAQPNTKVYDATTSAATLPNVSATTSGTGLVGTDSVAGLAETYASPNVSNNDTLSVSSYIVNDGNSGNNYTVTTQTAVGIITQRPLTIAAQPNTKVYDSTVSAATSPIVLGPPNGLGLAGSDTVTNLVETYASANVGNPVVLSVSPAYSVNDGNSGANYVVTLQTAMGVITPAPLTAAVTGTQIYGGSPSYMVTNYSGFVGGQTSSVVSGTLLCSTTATTLSPVGSYSVSSCSGLSASNYAITYLYGTLTVSPAPLTASVTGTQVYGGLPTFTAGYSGFVNSDNSSVVIGALACSTSATSSSFVAGGPYSTSNCSGLSAINYTIAYVYGAFSVTPAPLTAIVTGPSPFTVASYAGFVNADTSSSVSGTLTCSVNANPDSAGNFPLSCSGLSTPNYNIAYSYAYTPAVVNLHPLTVTVAGTSPNFTPSSYSGFVGSDNSSVVTGTLSCTASGTADSAGNYPLSCAGLSAPNYAISYSYSVGSVAVNPAPLTVTVNGTQLYGGTPAFTPTYFGFIGTDTIASAVTGTLACSTNATSTSTVGNSYSVACEGLGATATYNIALVGGAFSVTPTPLTITVNGANNNRSPTYTPTYSGLVNGDLPSVVSGKLSCTLTPDGLGNFTPSNCTGLSAPINYTINYVNGTVTGP